MSITTAPTITGLDEPGDTLVSLAGSLLGGAFGRVDADLPCLEADADLWFAEQGSDVERAKALCGPCPMRQECLRGALDRGEPWGVWGGEVFLGGQIVPTKRGRGRPRKNQAA